MQYKPLAALPSNDIRDQRGLKCTRYLTQLQADLPCSAWLLQSSILKSSNHLKHIQHNHINTAYSKFGLVQCRSLSQPSPSLPTTQVRECWQHSSLLLKPCITPLPDTRSEWPHSLHTTELLPPANRNMSTQLETQEVEQLAQRQMNRWEESYTKGSMQKKVA